jgi:hypothetical protein
VKSPGAVVEVELTGIGLPTKNIGISRTQSLSGVRNEPATLERRYQSTPTLLPKYNFNVDEESNDTTGCDCCQFKNPMWKMVKQVCCRNSTKCSTTFTFLMRALPVVMSLWMLGDQVLDVLATKTYWEYGKTSDYSSGFFILALGIWTLTPILYAFYIYVSFLKCLFSSESGNNERNHIFKKIVNLTLKCFRTSANDLSNMNQCWKFILAFLTLVYTIIISPLITYIFVPISSLAIAWVTAELPFSRLIKAKGDGNVLWWEINKSDTIFFRRIEGGCEALPQLLLAVIFFCLNKDFLQIRESAITGRSEADSLITSIIFSWGSLIFTCVSPLHNYLTQKYGNNILMHIICRKRSLQRRDIFILVFLTLFIVLWVVVCAWTMSL